MTFTRRPSRGKLSRDATTLAVKSVVIDRMSIARIAGNLGVAWNTAHDAILTAAQELLINDPHRLSGVTTIGVDEQLMSMCGVIPALATSTSPDD